MELLVAGFATVLLANALDPIGAWAAALRTNAGEEYFANLLVGALTTLVTVGVYLTLANLIISVIMRSLWISAIGVRSFSGDIDLDTIGARPRFDAFLRRRLRSFDRYIERLDNVCSAVFALSFLLVFALLGVTVFFVLFAAAGRTLGQTTQLFYDKSDVDFAYVFIPLVLCLAFVSVLIGALSVIDFVSGGALKRIRWLAPVYYPVYRFTGWISLARIYRPLYYNLVDHPLGRRLVLLLVPVAGITLSAMLFKGETFTPDYPREGTFGYGGRADFGEGDAYALVKRPHLDGEPRGDLIGLYIPLRGPGHSHMMDSCEMDLERLSNVGPGHFERQGLAYGLETYSNAVDCVAGFHRVSIDGSPLANLSYVFRQQEYELDGAIYTELDLSTLPSGRHFVSVERIRTDSGYAHVATIPFLRP